MTTMTCPQCRKEAMFAFTECPWCACNVAEWHQSHGTAGPAAEPGTLGAKRPEGSQRYGAALLVSALLTFSGLLTIVGAGVGLAAGLKQSTLLPEVPLIFGCIVVAILGLLQIAGGQIVRAVIDQANNSFRIAGLLQVMVDSRSERMVP